MYNMELSRMDWHYQGYCAFPQPCGRRRLRSRYHTGGRAPTNTPTRKFSTTDGKGQAPIPTAMHGCNMYWWEEAANEGEEDTPNSWLVEFLNGRNLYRPSVDADISAGRTCSRAVGPIFWKAEWSTERNLADASKWQKIGEYQLPDFPIWNNYHEWQLPAFKQDISPASFEMLGHEHVMSDSLL